MAWVIWITGLPGSGKSTVGRELKKELDAKMVAVTVLRLDEFRKKIVPQSKYTEEEREFVYQALAREGARLVKDGISAIIDATAHRKKWRDLARDLTPNFMEVDIKCPLDVCIERESNRQEGLVTADLYKKALERKKTGQTFKELGEVVGVDVPYELNEKAEVIIESDKKEPPEAVEMIIKKLEEKGWL
jgi:adenylylsulfate kinase